MGAKATPQRSGRLEPNYRVVNSNRCTWVLRFDYTQKHCERLLQHVLHAGNVYDCG